VGSSTGQKKNLETRYNFFTASRFICIFAPKINLKHVFIILTIAGILLQTFSKGIVFIHFNLNRAYIAQNLCVKKDQADNCCKGSCHLKKQLKEDDQKSNSSSSNSLKDKTEIQFFSQSKSNLVNPLPIRILLVRPYSFPKTASPVFPVFHPPQA
jgi:hypothetical protein